MQGEVQMQSQPVVMPPAPVMPPTGPAQVQVQIPPGLAPGQVFQVNANGQLISVTVPAGCPPGAVLAGDVQVGDSALIGLGVRVMPGRAVGAGSVVGAGALVTRDAPAGTTVLGFPARERRPR